MKKLMMLCMASLVMMSMGAFAKDTKKDADKKEVKVHGYITDPMCAKSGDKAKFKDAECAKKCAKDGKYAFVNMPDGKVWMIENPEAVKGHEGHHVSITGHANAGASTLHVMTVSMMKDKEDKKGKKAHKEKHDEMKHDDMKN